MIRDPLVCRSMEKRQKRGGRKLQGGGMFGTGSDLGGSHCRQRGRCPNIAREWTQEPAEEGDKI